MKILELKHKKANEKITIWDVKEIQICGHLIVVKTKDNLLLSYPLTSYDMKIKEE